MLKHDNRTNIIRKICSGIVCGILLMMLLSNVASAVHIIDTSAVRYTTTTNWGTLNPNTLLYTAGTGSSVMILGIVTAGTAYRADGTPTFNGKSFISIGRNMDATPEGAAELWYLLLDPSDTGSAHTVSVPDANTIPMNFYVATFKSSTGASALDAFASSSGTWANPNNSVTTTVNGDAIVSVLFSGSGTSTGAINYGGIQLYVNDPGAYFGKLGYKINESTGTNFSGWTVTQTEDFALITAAFKEVSASAPPTPSNLASTRGSFWVNNTWEAGAGSVSTDSYNVSVNGTWTNSTETSINTSVDPHGWSNVTIYAFNNTGSGNLSTTPALLNTQVANNVPVQTLADTWGITAGNLLTFTVSANDADSDPLTFDTNATGGTLNQSTGVYSWMPSSADAGAHFWFFRSNDSYGGIATNTTTINVAPTSGIYINGTVRSGGNAVEGVRVSTNTSINTTTDASGFYSLPVTAGAYELTAVRDPMYYTNSSVTAAVDSGVVVRDIELLIKPTGTISGSVTDA